MIRVTRLNGSGFVLNCDIIETIEETPDTVISTTNGKKFIVAESVEQIIAKVLEYKREMQIIVKRTNNS